MLDRISVPIVQAPMAGGPSTPQLAAAVSGCGALGFVAAGYRTPEAMSEDIAATRALTDCPFGINVFAVTDAPADPEAIAPYVAEVAAEARAAGTEPGEPRSDDDHFAAKIERLVADPPAVVSFTFGCPPADVLAALRSAGASVWVTVTDATEARRSVAAGADALVVQGVEGGGHRGFFADGEHNAELSVLALLQLVGAAVEVPLVATGGIATGRAVAAVLAAGAAAAQLGTAFMRCPEAGTAPVHRDALASATPTALTRAFTGRLARGIENRFLLDHSATAPHAYPEIHHVTTPLRVAARAAGDPDLINLWAGQTHELTREVPAAQLVGELAAEARAALGAATRRL